MRNAGIIEPGNMSAGLCIGLLLFFSFLWSSLHKAFEPTIVESATVSAQDPDANWVPFGPQCHPLRGNGYELASNGTDLYAGGFFYARDLGIWIQVMRWDGTQWHAATLAIKNGFNSGLVHAIAVVGDDLYIGGLFTRIEEVEAKNIAKWDGVSWSALGNGLDDEVRTIEIKNGIVYAGGDFVKSGVTVLNRIGKWNGNEWSGIGSGFNESVWTIAFKENEIYAGGNFSAAGEVVTNKIARWDGFQWNAMGTGMNLLVKDLAIHGNDVYAGGFFFNVDGMIANHIAKWDGSSWSTLGAGLNSNVNSVLFIGDTLFVAGAFSMAGEVSAGGVAKWDGTQWKPVLPNLQQEVEDMVIHENKLVLAGSHFNIDQRDFSIVGWEFPGWDFFCHLNSDGIDNSVKALASNNNKLFAGGIFKSAGVISSIGMASWDGHNWDQVGGVSFQDVRALASDANNIYAGGDLSIENIPSTDNIAKWDGSQWSALGTGIDGEVRVLRSDGNNLYAGGFFTSAGGVEARSIAKWNGTEWSALGPNGVIESEVNYISAILVLGEEVYVGGSFFKIGGITAKHIAKWDGTTWSALGSGTNFPVRSLEHFNNKIYAGGDFTTAGGIEANYIAKWDGDEWKSLSQDLDGSVYALSTSENHIYAGGNFTETNDGISLSHIGRWDGTNWDALGSGTNGPVYTLLSTGDKIFVGGDFDTAGQRPSSHIAQWNFYTTSTEDEMHSAALHIYPNPAKDFLMIDLKDIEPSRDLFIEVYSMDGELRLKQREVTSDLYKLNITSLQSGNYFLHVDDGSKTITKKFVVIR